jgi:long-chain acyl-CoA synthetase
LIGNPVLRTLGWNNLRSLVVTSIEVPPEIAATIASLGLDVEQGYAVVEAGLVGVRRRDSGFSPLDGATVSERDGILAVRSPVAESEMLTGDVGRAGGATFDVEGPAASRLTVGDTTILAAAVERKLRQSPFIALAIVTADRGVIHASIEVDRVAVSAWAADRGLHFTTYSSLVRLAEVEALVADEVARLTTEVASHDLLHRPLQQGRDITRTRTTVHRRPNAAGAEDAPAALAEPASALE